MFEATTLLWGRHGWNFVAESEGGGEFPKLKLSVSVRKKLRILTSFAQCLPIHGACEKRHIKKLSNYYQKVGGETTHMIKRHQLSSITWNTLLNSILCGMASNAFPAFSVLVNTGEPLDFQYFITYLGIGAYGAEGSFPKCLKIQASKQTLG